MFHQFHFLSVPHGSKETVHSDQSRMYVVQDLTYDTRNSGSKEMIIDMKERRVNCYQLLASVFSAFNNSRAQVTVAHF
jgi:hypothetical protein